LSEWCVFVSSFFFFKVRNERTNESDVRSECSSTPQGKRESRRPSKNSKEAFVGSTAPGVRCGVFDATDAEREAVHPEEQFAYSEASMYGVTLLLRRRRVFFERARKPA